MNYLRRSIFWLLLVLLDTYLVTNMISTLGIVIELYAYALARKKMSVVDSLGLGITSYNIITVLYMCTRHPDLVSFAFCAIPIFHIII